jgi:hypothetical protein
VFRGLPSEVVNNKPIKNIAAQLEQAFQGQKNVFVVLFLYFSLCCTTLVSVRKVLENVSIFKNPGWRDLLGEGKI